MYAEDGVGTDIEVVSKAESLRTAVGGVLEPRLCVCLCVVPPSDGVVGNGRATTI